MIIPDLRVVFEIEKSISVSESEIKIQSKNLREIVEWKTGLCVDEISIVIDDLDNCSICCSYTAFGEEYYIYFPVILLDYEFDLINCPA